VIGEAIRGFWRGLEIDRAFAIGLANLDAVLVEHVNCAARPVTQNTYRGDLFTIGDIGYLDEDGFLYLTDRQSNMIISGGANIYPQETENHLIMHPKVDDVAVIGVPNEDMGEEVKAVVVPAADAEPGEALERELIEYCRSAIAHYKCPRSIDFATEVPRTEAGKMAKRTLRAKYWEGHGGTIV